MQPDGQTGHHVGYTGPTTIGTAIVPNLLESHLSIQLPGANPLISTNSDFKANGGILETPVTAGGTRVSFQDVDYIVRNQANRRDKLKILSQVSGFFNPGEMVAVMGPSGSGQSLATFPTGRNT